ncbi:DUF423 domain-containing protein [Litoribacter alkaliphilus]|uniref:DUF423 domain-containing protein n=1 Tax=Litoribacter ruber TaxID=702568 RepID=A0AAP2CGP8_9BACT|nr:DUF423 domain-containing protein [Litoribacter alkaliphilus]MBS9522866.1 DUF423 domain-containing protein [Litoribacter alkaliphilus]
MHKERIIQVGAVLGALAVGIGAFGAHGLADMLEMQGRAETFETGVKYHFYHALAMLLVGILSLLKLQEKWIKRSAWLFLAGIVIFSGSLYVLSLTGITWLGAITPFGGVAFIAGWVCVAMAKYEG